MRNYDGKSSKCKDESESYVPERNVMKNVYYVRLNGLFGIFPKSPRMTFVR